MSDPDVSTLPSVQQAMRIIDSVPVQPRTIRVKLADADGLRLARPLTADRDYPPFNKSQMDGYAVRRADVAAPPVDLRVVGEIPAGKWPDRGIGPGEAMAIMTGAPMPEGAEGVVPVEDVEKIDAQTVRILVATGNPARHVAPRGAECQAGQVVLREGTRLGPAQIAVAASIGAAEVDVFDRPSVAVLATGNELVPVGDLPGPSQIRNSNTPMFVSLLRRMGCAVTDLGVAPDEPAALRAAIESGLQYDALFITGGMSMGEYDYVPRILTDLAVDLKITKLRIKPGKPFVFGVSAGAGNKRGGEWATRGGGEKTETGRGGEGVTGRGGEKKGTENGSGSPHLPLTPSPPHPLSSSPSSPPLTLSPPHPVSFIFGLPGNPVSGFVCTVRLASRLVSRLAGGAVEDRWLSGKLDTGMPANGPREFYQPALRTVAAGRDSSHAELATITPLKWKGSADLFTLAQANVLLVRPENDPTLPKGTVVRVLEI